MPTIDALADQYRKDGYQVIVNPKPEGLPTFARDSIVDLFAQKDRHIVLLQLGEDKGPLKATDEGLSYVGSLILEAEELLRGNSPRAAIALAWAAVEAAARDILRQATVEPHDNSTKEMIQALISIGRLSPHEANNLMFSMNLRNMVVHGVRPDNVSPEAVLFLIDLARRLVRTTTDQADRTVSVFFSILGDRLQQENVIKGLVDRPTAILREVIGPSAGLISATWDLAQDGRGRPVITLSISDFTGSVTTTFSPPELTDDNQMGFRLNRLWGDLLRIRSHKEIDAVIRTSGGVGVG